MKIVDEHKTRKRYNVSDMMLEDASYKLNENQFLAWSHAVLRGYSNIKISDEMSDAERIIWPSDVQKFLDDAAKRGFGVPGEDAPRKKAA